VEEVGDGLEEVFRALDRNCGIVLVLRSFHVTKGSIIGSIQFTGPLVQKNRIRADITLNEKLIFDPEWRVVNTVYPDLPEFRVKVYSLKEILIEKLRSIIQRGKSRDYYDVWRILKENEFNMKEVRDLLIKKCQINEIAYKPELIFDDERLREAERYWQPALGELTKELPVFGEVVSKLKEKLIP
jgi:predicted nucleotidyltransferase component of viral defense system